MAAASISNSPPARLQLGVIAEDETDGQAVRVLLQRLRGGGTKVLTRSDQGCGAIGRKGERWVNDLVRCGCSAVIIVHDLDRRALGELQQQLAKIQPPSGTALHVCIPIEELEAWFWADANVLTKIARQPTPAHPSPEKITSPKEALMRLSRDGGKKPRYATSDNAALAQELDLAACAQRCPSFAALGKFVAGL